MVLRVQNGCRYSIGIVMPVSNGGISDIAGGTVFFQPVQKKETA